jgi:hypothetical protein
MEHTLKISLLSRGKFMIEDDEVSFMGGNLGRHLLNLPFASKSGRIRTLSPTTNDSTDRSAGRLGKQPHLFHLFSNIIRAEIELNDNRTLACCGTLNHENAFRKSTTIRLPASAACRNKLRRGIEMT